MPFAKKRDKIYVARDQPPGFLNSDIYILDYFYIHKQ